MVEPLLKITTIPITYELKVQNARLEYKNSTAELEISRNEGGMRIKSRPIKINLDTFEARNSVIPTTRESIRRSAQQGKNAAYEATATLASEGQLLLKAKLGEDMLSQVFAQRNQLPTGDFNIGFIPTSGPNIQWSQPDLTIAYEMDKLNFDLKVSNGNFEFIPGDIQVMITQQPDVKIEYIGEPIYVPPSSAEHFSPVDVTV